MKSKQELLTVNFYDAKGGWLYYNLSVGQQSFNNMFSDALDPLLNFKYWLEAISTGVQQTSFNYDNEVQRIKFDFEHEDRDREILTVSEVGLVNGNIFIKENIDRRQMVKAFYHGLLAFANSDKFISTEWEVEYLKERLCQILHINEATLIQEYANLDKKELGKLLSIADSKNLSSNPDAIEEKEEWNIPDEFTFWTSEKKRDFFIKSINETTSSSCYGMIINEFHSSIIERYLEAE